MIGIDETLSQNEAEGGKRCAATDEYGSTMNVGKQQLDRKELAALWGNLPRRY